MEVMMILVAALLPVAYLIGFNVGKRTGIFIGRDQAQQARRQAETPSSSS